MTNMETFAEKIIAFKHIVKSMTKTQPDNEYLKGWKDCLDTLDSRMGLL